MDPNANWEEQLEIAERLLQGRLPFHEVDSLRLAELVLALNEWIQKGGFLPAAWKRG
jgi:acyl carrier protein